MCYTISEPVCRNRLRMRMSNKDQTTALVTGETLIYQRGGEGYQLPVGTSAWYAWLQTATIFRVRSPFGTFTMLPLPSLLERLEHRLAVLTGGPRDAPARQHTLRNTIAWSYELLSEEEQRLFRLLAVFIDGCELAAAEAVYSAQGGERALVLDGVTALLDKHLLYQGKQGDHAPRLLLHETIREYGLEALGVNQELEMARQSHAEYYLRLAEEAEEHLEGTEQAVWLERLEREYANLRAALQWMLEQHAHEMALRLSGALFHFWEGHGHLHEGRTFLERALASGQEVAEGVRAKALHAAGFLAVTQGDLERGAALVWEAVVLHRELGDARRLAWSLFLLGYIAWTNGDFGTARSHAEEGLAVARAGDEKAILAYLLDLLGQIALDHGEDTSARALLEEGLTLHREMGDTRGSLNALIPLKRVLAALGETTRARACAEEQLSLSRTVGYPVGAAGALSARGGQRADGKWAVRGKRGAAARSQRELAHRH